MLRANNLVTNKHRQPKQY